MKWLKWLWGQAFKYRCLQVIRWRPFFLYIGWEPRIGFDFDFDIRWVPWHHACTEDRHQYEWRPQGCQGWNSDFAINITLFWVTIAVDIPNPNLIADEEDKAGDVEKCDNNPCCGAPGHECACDEMHVEVFAPSSRSAKDVHVCGICDDCTMCNKDCCNDCLWEADYQGGVMKPYCNCDGHSCPTYIAEVSTSNANLRVQLSPEELPK